MCRDVATSNFIGIYLAMLWRFLVKIIKMVVSGLRIASTTPKEAADEDKFVQQPPKLKSPYGDKDPNVYRVN
jgi:hypothetical protein